LEGNVVPEKRKLLVGGAAIAAAIALAGCAPAGYNAAAGGGTQAAANNQDTTTTDPGADNTGADQAPAQKATPGDLTADQTTDELNAATVKRMGQTVQNEDGFVLYRFDGDTAGATPKSNCDGDCAKIWPPALTNDGKPKLKGVDANVVGTVTRTDGTKQLTIKGWPVYTYVGDKVAGTWKGQNVGGKWFVVKPDGTKNLTCLPAISKPVAPPDDSAGAADSGGASGSAGGDYSY
jgi:predicted lipoprotein with Yx(FWY)xxD motif